MEQLGSVSVPDVPIRINLCIDEVKKIAFDLYGINVVKIEQLNGYDDKNYYIGENDESYVLKIINSVDSKKPEIFEAQSLLLIHLGNRGICCPQPVQTKKGNFFEQYKLKSGDHIIRLLKYIDGEILEKVPQSPNLFYQVGKSAAQMDMAMESFSHPAYTNYQSLWMLESIPQLTQFLSAVQDIQRQKLVKTVITQFIERILNSPKKLEKGLIHGDFNEQNIIVNKKNEIYQIKAVIDYGDCHIGCYLYEVAITMTYMIMLAKDIEAGGLVLAGYSSLRKVSDEECALLKLCISARLCQSLVIGAYTNQQDPQNTYVLTTATYGWYLLEKLWKISDDELLKEWKNVKISNDDNI